MSCEKDSIFTPVVVDLLACVVLHSLYLHKTTMAYNDLNLLTATATEIGSLLESGSLTSKQLVHAYIEQIRKHDDYLKAVIAIAPIEILMKRAEILDEERLAGKVRGRIHGIPILLKVSRPTCLSL